MSDEKEVQNEQEQENSDKAQDNLTIRLEAVKALKEYQKPDSQWTLTQEILQEIYATHLISNPEVKPPATKMVEELKKEIELRYKDNEELKILLLTSIPSIQAIYGWFKKEGWKDAVWSKVRIEGLFTESKRAQMIESLFKRGTDRDTTAAKIWLTLSGDYQEKMDINSDKTIETFREINSILLKKRNEEE